MSLNPHARGADESPARSSARRGPQPPRTWGRLLPARPVDNSLTSTPTHVGQTALVSIAVAAWLLNPHARGADRQVDWPLARRSPQPPRTWGRHQAQGSQAAGEPSTPTHVGQTSTRLADFDFVHLNPHARGADSSTAAAAYRAGPQPPRTWGRLLQDLRCSGNLPSTPTHVGQTTSVFCLVAVCLLNPHARGADPLGAVRLQCHTPQPPRTWGRPAWSTIGSEHLPSTPTHVGQTEEALAVSNLLSLNPHARGADAVPQAGGQPASPQPPRTWGRHS